MLGLKILLTGLVVLVVLAVVKNVIEPTTNIAYTLIGVGAVLAFTTVFTGALVLIWSL